MVKFYRKSLSSAFSHFFLYAICYSIVPIVVTGGASDHSSRQLLDGAVYSSADATRLVTQAIFHSHRTATQTPREYWLVLIRQLYFS